MLNSKFGLAVSFVFCCMLGCVESKQQDPWPDRDPIFTSDKISDLDYVRQRIEDGLDTETLNNTRTNNDHLLTYAVRSNAVDTVRYLIEAGAEVDVRSPAYDKTPLFQAAYDNNLEIATILIKNGSDVNAQDNLGNRPLREAILGKRPAMVRLLLESGADPTLENHEGRSLIDLAMSSRQTRLDRSSMHTINEAALWS